MAHEVTAALITGVCTLAVGFFGGKALYNNLSINIDGQEVTIDKQDYKKLYSGLEKENEELKTQLAQKDTENQQNRPEFINNIRLVIDSTEIGNVYRGLADNGELLLSASAISDYIGKPITWDISQNTIFIGDDDNKIAKEIPLWNTPYLEVADSEFLVLDEEDKSIGFKASTNQYYGNDTINDDGKFEITNYVIYPLNGKALQIKGSFGVDFSNGASDTPNHDDVQVTFLITDSNNNIIYKSPILTKLSQEVDFITDVSGSLNVKLSVSCIESKRHSSSDICYIKNLTAVTTDY